MTAEKEQLRITDNIIRILLIELVGCKIRFGRTHKVEKRFEGVCHWVDWRKTTRRGGSFFLMCSYKNEYQDHIATLKTMLSDYASHISELIEKKCKPLKKRRKLYECRNMSVNSSLDLELYLNDKWCKFGEYFPNNVRMMITNDVKAWVENKAKIYKEKKFQHIVISTNKIQSFKPAFTHHEIFKSSIQTEKTKFLRLIQYEILPKTLEFVMKNFFTSSEEEIFENMRNYVLLQLLCWIEVPANIVSTLKCCDFYTETDSNTIHIKNIKKTYEPNSLFHAKLVCGSIETASNFKLCLLYYKTFEEQYRIKHNIQKRPEYMFYNIYNGEQLDENYIIKTVSTLLYRHECHLRKKYKLNNNIYINEC